MKKITYSIVLLLVFIGFNSCEKDDICVDGTTPLLIISFYDIDDTETLKAPANLVVKGQLYDDTFGAVITNTGTDSIQVPLRLEALNTVFSLTTNETTDATNDNEDQVNFTYTLKEVFVSRACGYIVNYENLTVDLTADTNNWIKNIKVVNTTVENENAAHVKIYH